MCFSVKEEKLEGEKNGATSVKAGMNRTQMGEGAGSKEDKNMTGGNSCRGILKSNRKGKSNHKTKNFLNSITQKPNKC